MIMIKWVKILNKLKFIHKTHTSSYVTLALIWVNAINSGSVLNTGNRLLYTMMSYFAAFIRFAAFHPIIS